MVEPMRQRFARNRHAEIGRVGEIGEALLTRRMILAEDHLALGAVQRLPMPDTAFQGAADARRQVRMAAQHLVIDRDRPQAWRGL